MTGETENLRKLGAVTGKFTRKMLTRAVLDELRETDMRMCKSYRRGHWIGCGGDGQALGSTFTDERDNRAGPGAKPQRKGQISRKLKTELRKELADGDD